MNLKPRASASRPSPRDLDDALTNPLYAVRLVNGEARPTQAAIDAADEASRKLAERRSA